LLSVLSIGVLSGSFGLDYVCWKTMYSLRETICLGVALWGLRPGRQCVRVGTDWHAEYFYQTSPALDPQGPARGSFWLLRGGEWNEKPPNLRASYRGWDDVTYWGQHSAYTAQKICPDGALCFPCPVYL